MKIDSGLLTDFIVSIPFIVYFLHQIRSKSKYYIFKCVVISFLCFYIILLVKYAVFPIYISGSIKEMMREELSFSESLAENINLIPFIRGWYPKDFLLNIIMTLPLGVLLPCLIKGMTKKSMTIVGLGVGIAIELVQFLIFLFQGFTFRDININDSLANAIGVIIGFAIYTFAVRIFIEETKSTQIKTLRMVRNFLIDQGQYMDG